VRSSLAFAELPACRGTPGVEVARVVDGRPVVVVLVEFVISATAETDAP
jgi:hypothetical protein